MQMVTGKKYHTKSEKEAYFFTAMLNQVPVQARQGYMRKDMTIFAFQSQAKQV